MNSSVSRTVVVVGGGHAGIEAAHAAARMGADVVLVTLRADCLVRLSCNPAVGGIGKGHLVREIDALGGVMGRAADLAGIHFRLLNRSRGPAVQGPRVQLDFDAYPLIAGRMIEEQRIRVLEGEVTGFEIERGSLRAVVTAAGDRIGAAAAVVTTGTFLGGLLFRGEDVTPGGRVGEPPSTTMRASLAALGLRLDRFKTGTPPRIETDSIDWESCEIQPGDDRPVPMSFDHMGPDRFAPPLAQVPTYLTYSNPHVHDVVRAVLDRSPLFTGRIRARGPRYCPSFEDKVVRFADRARHLLHLEPMGLRHPWTYVNGLSTSLPAEIQEEIVHGIHGLEAARIARFGYAVEYDFVPPTQLRSNLGVPGAAGLFLAGQLCGTTGYEEAAGLGLVAGVNAARHAAGSDPWIPDRFTSYLGVMLDDLTTTGVLEPYRMFTSRAEFRLSMSPDSADRRLTPIGVALGLVSPHAAARSNERWERIERARAILDGTGSLRGARPAAPADRIRRGEAPDEVIAEELPPDLTLAGDELETLAALLRYRGYLEREQRDVERLREAERCRLPEGFRYDGISGLSNEVRERLNEVSPVSLGQAARIPGVTPAAVALLAAAIANARRPSH